MYFTDVEFTDATSVSSRHLCSLLQQQIRNPVIRLPLTEEEKGLIYWIGTSRHAHGWENPYQKIKLINPTGMYAITGESAVSHYPNPETILFTYNGSKDTLCTAVSDHNGCHFSIDLGTDFIFSMDAYTLYCQYHPSSWFINFGLAVSMDSKEWTVVKRHHNELPGTWKCTPTSYFRYIKIFRDLEFWKVSSHQLLLSGFELYGTVKFVHHK
jgi:hypothetical protein